MPIKVQANMYVFIIVIIILFAHKIQS